MFQVQLPISSHGVLDHMRCPTAGCTALVEMPPPKRCPYCNKAIAVDTMNPQGNR